MAEPDPRSSRTLITQNDIVVIGDGTNVRLPPRAVYWPVHMGQIPAVTHHYQLRAADQELVAAFQAGGARTAVVTGMGGVGKTQIAARYAEKVSGDLDLVLWVSAAGGRDAVLETYAHAACTLQLVEADLATERAAATLLDWLRSTDRKWLLVLDDVGLPGELRSLWPPGVPGGWTVITTRHRGAGMLGNGRHVISVDVFDRAQSDAYFRTELPGETPAAISTLGNDLGHLPLALAHAVAYIMDTGLSVDRYRALLSDGSTSIAKLFPHADELGEGFDQTIASTWLLSTRLAETLAPGVGKVLLRAASVLDPSGIPLALFTSESMVNRIMGDLGTDVVEHDAHAGLQVLHRLHLVTVDDTTSLVRMHNLVQRVTREALKSADDLGEIAYAVADGLVEIWPAEDFGIGLVFRVNTAALEGHARAELIRDGAVHSVLVRAGESLAAAGQVAAAAEYMETLHNAAVDRLGADYPESWALRNNAALWRAETGDATGAVAELTKVLELIADQLGAGSPEYVWVYNNLAYARGLDGDVVGAIKAYSELLKLQSAVATTTVDVLRTRNNIALWTGRAGLPELAASQFEALLRDVVAEFGETDLLTLKVRGNLVGAQSLAGAQPDFDGVLTDMARELGEDHPETLKVRHSYAGWLWRTGNHATARSVHEQVIADRIRVLGPDHPDCLITRSELAYERGMAGDPENAAENLTELLVDESRVLGPRHPHTLTSRLQRASILPDVRAAAAELEQLRDDLLETPDLNTSLLVDVLRTLASRYSAIDDEHRAAEVNMQLLQLLQVQVRTPVTNQRKLMETMYHLARWRGRTGHPADARQAFLGLLTAASAVYGTDDRFVLTIRNEAAFWSREAGDLATASADFTALLADQIRVLGPEDRAVLATRSNLAALRMASGDKDGALTDFSTLLFDRRRILGAEHPATLMTMNNLGNARASAGDEVGAVAQFEELLGVLPSVVGEDHRDTMVNRYSLAQLKTSTGDLDGAIEEYERLLAACIRKFGHDDEYTNQIRHLIGHLRDQQRT